MVVKGKLVLSTERLDPIDSGFYGIWVPETREFEVTAFAADIDLIIEELRRVWTQRATATEA